MKDLWRRKYRYFAMTKHGQMQIQTQQSFTVADVKCRQETSNAPETFKFMEMWSFVREVPLYFFLK